MKPKTSPLQVLLLALGGIAFALVAGEILVRLFLPTPFLRDFLLQFPSGVPLYSTDPELGYLPRQNAADANPGFHYDSVGVNQDLSIRKEQAAKTILFLGDSVTRRGYLLRALDHAYTGNSWEFLNAGVEGYNVPQEAKYFARYVAAAQPNRIVVSVHINDLLYFPMTQMKSPREIFWYFPGEKPIEFYLDLYRLSALYQHWVTAQYSYLTRKVRERNSLVPDTQAALRSLTEWGAAHGAKVQVIVLPIMRRFDEWTEEEKKSHETALHLSRELGIETFDLMKPLEQALADKIVLTDENAADYWHPSREAANYFGEYLRDQGIFRDLPGGEGREKTVKPKISPARKRE